MLWHQVEKNQFLICVMKVYNPYFLFLCLGTPFCFYFFLVETIYPNWELHLQTLHMLQGLVLALIHCISFYNSFFLYLHIFIPCDKESSNQLFKCFGQNFFNLHQMMSNFQEHFKNSMDWLLTCTSNNISRREVI